jgi:hypothetical protein
MGKEFDVLEGPGDPFLGYLVRFEMGDLFSLEENLSGIGRVDSADAIKDGGFSRPIRSDDRIDPAFFDLKAHIVDGFDATKSNGQIFNFKD